MVITIRTKSLIVIDHASPSIPISYHITKMKDRMRWSAVATNMNTIGQKVIRMQANHLFYKSYCPKK